MAASYPPTRWSAGFGTTTSFLGELPTSLAYWCETQLVACPRKSGRFKSRVLWGRKIAEQNEKKSIQRRADYWDIAGDAGRKERESGVWRAQRERGASASSDGRRGWAPEATGGRFVGSEPDLEGSERKKMVSPSTRRRAVKMSVEEGWSAGKTAAACRALGLARSSYYRESRVGLEGRRVRKEVVELSGKHPRYGYRRITALLRRDGFTVNPKRVARIRREEGLKVSKRQRRMRRVGASTAERKRAQRPREVWSWDFVEDQTEAGSRFRHPDIDR